MWFKKKKWEEIFDHERFLKEHNDVVIKILWNDWLYRWSLGAKKEDLKEELGKEFERYFK